MLGFLDTIVFGEHSKTMYTQLAKGGRYICQGMLTAVSKLLI